MTVEEAKGVCKDRSKWKEVISAYPKGKQALITIMITKFNDAKDTFFCSHRKPWPLKLRVIHSISNISHIQQ
jgi:hypothetical protein